MWVEVKEIDPPASQQMLNIAASELKNRLNDVPGKYGVQAWVTSGFEARKAKIAVNLLKKELEVGLSNDEQLIIAIPEGQFTRRLVQIRWKNAKGKPIRLVTVDNGGKEYGCPSMASPADWTDEVTVGESSGGRKVEAYKIISDAISNALTIWVTQANQHVGLGGVGSANATQLNTIDRIRRCIEDAARQIKSGQNFKEGPGVVEIYNDHMPANREELFSACFGDLNAAFDPNTNNVSQFYGMNGVLRANKNKAVSAVVYRSRLFKDVSVVNNHARYPIDEHWLDGTIVR